MQSVKERIDNPLVIDNSVHLAHCYKLLENNMGGGKSTQSNPHYLPMRVLWGQSTVLKLQELTNPLEWDELKRAHTTTGKNSIENS